MRLGQVRGAATRQTRYSRLHCDREAAPKLRTLFPLVERLHFELSFEGGGAATPVPQSHILHPPARAYFSFPCPYADCDGRFELTAAVHAVVEDPTHRIEGVLECAGSRVSDFRSKPLCQLRLNFALTAVCSPPLSVATSEGVSATETPVSAPALDVRKEADSLPRTARSRSMRDAI